jgi:hypothetical protein
LNHRRKECQIAGLIDSSARPIAVFLPCNDPEVNTTTQQKTQCGDRGTWLRIHGKCHRKPFVGHVDPYENFVQGGMISAFIRKHGITATNPNRKFEVRVINHPKGPVRP